MVGEERRGGHKKGENGKLLKEKKLLCKKKFHKNNISISQFLKRQYATLILFGNNNFSMKNKKQKTVPNYVNIL